MEKDVSCEWKDRKAGVAILISDQIDFKTKVIKKDKEVERTRWQRSRKTRSPSPTNTTKKAHLQNK